MSQNPTDLRYAATHEWARVEEDGSISVGITEHAQEALGDVVYVELPEIGRVFASAEQAGVVESVKAASDVYAPLAGEVIAVNDALRDSPELINEQPYQAWFYRLAPKDVSELDALLDAAGYAASIG